MKADCLEEKAMLVDFLAGAAANGGARRVKAPVTRVAVHADKMSYWQLILLQSEANGCFYHGEDLPQTNWEWPKNTWFRDRLSHRPKVSDSGCGELR